MSFDAITGIAQAEDAAKVAVQYAQAQAKQMLADAESEGKAEIEAAVARAEKELRVLRQKSDVKSVEDAKKLLNELETKKAVQAKLDAAASLVAERVVKG